MKKSLEVISLLIMGSVMVIGFQNCGNSSFTEDNDLVESTPLSSINVDDTEYTEGLSFDFLSKTSEGTTSEFQVQKLNNDRYSAQDGAYLISCTLEGSNPMKSLVEITNTVEVTHPTLQSNEICDTDDEALKHFKIGNTSPVYLVALSQDQNCLMDDPQRLLDEGKRVFVIENIYFEEIVGLVEDSRALSDTELCTINTISAEED